MVDLRSQYERLKADIDSAVAGVISSTAFIKGPDVRLFEEDLQRYLGIRHVISCANGTDALQIAMMALGLKPGDEVITTNFTFIATVEVIELLGLKTVLVEPEPGTFNISPRQSESHHSPDQGNSSGTSLRPVCRHGTNNSNGSAAWNPYN
jgi:dTDP-4-amino-4,6-dideoxygalactose transaminase